MSKNESLIERAVDLAVDKPPTLSDPSQIALPNLAAPTEHGCQLANH